MKRKHIFFIFIILFSQTQIMIVNSITNPPTKLDAGRYAIYDDEYWYAKVTTVEEFEAEGYNIPDEYPSDKKILVNYTRSDYQFTIKIESLSSSEVTLANIEGEHDVNISVYEIDDNSKGILIASFSSRHQTTTSSWETEGPYYGMMIDPSIFVLGNQFTSEPFIYTVKGTETLDTMWGKNQTYIVEAFSEVPGFSQQMTIWCDAESGIFLIKLIVLENPVWSSHEEMMLVETGVRFDVISGGEVYEIPIVSNSVLNDANFDSQKSVFIVRVEGPAGTDGRMNVTIPREIVPTEHNFEVFVDNAKRDFLVYEDEYNFYVYIEHTHSVHTITINFLSSPQGTGIPGFPVETILLGIILYIFVLRSFLNLTHGG